MEKQAGFICRNSTAIGGVLIVGYVGGIGSVVGVRAVEVYGSRGVLSLGHVGGFCGIGGVG